MRKFNIEEAKAGKPVCTRDGRNARIICFDAKRGNYPIVALIDDKGVEYVSYFSLDGKYDNGVDSNDLFMKPETREGWGWVSQNNTCVSMFAQIYETKEEALRHKPDRSESFLAKVEWEE